MSQHETSFKAESPVPAATAKQLVANPETAKPPAAKGKLRRLLLAGAAAAVLAGGGWYGWDYCTVGRFQV